MKAEYDGYGVIRYMTMEMGVAHFNHIYDWTNKIMATISRCGLNGQYWISTKGSGTIIVIHCEDYFFEGYTKQVAEAVKNINNANEFINLVENSGMLERGEYPWLQFKKDGE